MADARRAARVRAKVAKPRARPRTSSADRTLALPRPVQTRADSSDCAKPYLHQQRWQWRNRFPARSAGSLPSEVVALLGEQDEAATKDQANGAVNQRTQAEKELNSVRSSRKAYLCSWANYLQQMCTTVEPSKLSTTWRSNGVPS